MNIPEFDLVRLMRTVFEPKAGERVGVFIDLPEPLEVKGWKFLQDTPSVTQRIAYEVFYLGLLERKSELPFAKVQFYAYAPTGGSNLDLPPTVVDPEGQTLGLVEDVLRELDIVLYLSTYSATRPDYRPGQEMGFRGATAPWVQRDDPAHRSGPRLLRRVGQSRAVSPRPDPL